MQDVYSGYADVGIVRADNLVGYQSLSCVPSGGNLCFAPGTFKVLVSLVWLADAPSSAPHHSSVVAGYHTMMLRCCLPRQEALPATADYPWTHSSQILPGYTISALLHVDDETRQAVASALLAINYKVCPSQRYGKACIRVRLA